MATIVSDADFNQVIINSDKPAIVDFWAEWCGPCRMVGPVIEELAKDYTGKAVVAKLNVDENSEVSNTYGIRSIPTVLFFKNGKVVDKQVGAAPRKVYEDKLKAIL